MTKQNKALQTVADYVRGSFYVQIRINMQDVNKHSYVEERSFLSLFKSNSFYKINTKIYDIFTTIILFQNYL